MRAGYRLWQVLANLSAPDRADGLPSAADFLTEGELRLFRKLSAADRGHSLRVLAALLRTGERDDDLLAAALLHDVGKASTRLRPWERALAVVGRWLAPRWARTVGSGEPHGWRRAFVIAEQHPSWGAQVLRQAGSSRRLIWLVEQHQNEPPQPASGDLGEALRRLQAADDRN
jgi:putative nucleotidyltransferase with HDIG domain